MGTQRGNLWLDNILTLTLMYQNGIFWFPIAWRSHGIATSKIIYKHWVPPPSPPKKIKYDFRGEHRRQHPISRGGLWEWKYFGSAQPVQSASRPTSWLRSSIRCANGSRGPASSPHRFWSPPSASSGFWICACPHGFQNGSGAHRNPGSCLVRSLQWRFVQPYPSVFSTMRRQCYRRDADTSWAW